MKDRCPDAVPIGTGVLSEFKLTFDYWSKRRKCYVANITADVSTDSKVWGVLWSVTDSNLLALDGYEGVTSGIYQRINVDLLVFGVSTSAFSYQIRNPGKLGAPSAEYLDHLIEGARAFDLPFSYQTKLEAISPLQS
mgnify:FL=1|jgi:hypothetical protein|tara:strand:- start:257 stop:667 length:411 start_codon:yes stop_codon:yes gene_type:complete